jgi:hypothetical protein
MHSIRSLLFVIGTAVAVTGCASAGKTYAAKHPELTPEQRQIMTSGKIPGGTAVAGLTHEQVKIAMGGYPTTLDKISGEEAWIYVRKKLTATELTSADYGRTATTAGRADPFMASDNTGPQTDVNEKTTVFFQGDKATHAQVSEEKP